MALTTAIFVGESQEWIPDLVAKAKELQVNEGTVAITSSYSLVKIIPFSPDFMNFTLLTMYTLHFVKYRMSVAT